MNGAKLAFGMVCFLLFGTLALGYSMVVTSIPVTIAKAQTEVIEARAQAHIVSREQWKMDVLCQAAMLPDYNPRNPEPYIQRVLARQAA